VNEGILAMSHIRPRVLTSLDVRSPNQRGEGQVEEDSNLSKIIKYIPGEVIALHQALDGFAEVDGFSSLIKWLIVFLLISTPFWFVFTTKTSSESIAWSQVILSPIAFVVWLIAVQSPVITLISANQLNSQAGSLLLIFFTGMAPLFERIIVAIQRRIT
jgi:hypothetical protein